MNKFIHGDNLPIMKQMDSETIDLIATDPPFDKGKIFKGKDFEFSDVYENFLDYMIPRMEEMYRLLKPTGSLYWHCDPSISHYLKIELDKIFGIKQFRNEIVWCYESPSPTKRDFVRKHDIILRYSKSSKWVFNGNDVRVPYSKNSVKFNKTKDGKFTDEKMDGDLLNEGKIPRDWWVDVACMYYYKNQRCGYPTQKPVKLYERIIKASSNPNDIVLDPFCGSGTTLVAAAKNNRQWIGIDKNNVENLINNRMEQTLSKWFKQSSQ